MELYKKIARQTVSRDKKVPVRRMGVTDLAGILILQFDQAAMAASVAQARPLVGVMQAAGLS